MAEQWSAKRLTRGDVLVAGAICLILVVSLPGCLGAAKSVSGRDRCAANVAQIGKAMFAYANDYEDALPRAGGPTTVWGPTVNWTAPDRRIAYGMDARGGGSATISSSYYLLVKYHQVPTGVFVCPQDAGTTQFSLQELRGVPSSFTLDDAWDFGPLVFSWRHCSYAYHLPYGPYALTTSRDPDMAVAADRNPFLASPAVAPAPISVFKPDLPAFQGTDEQARESNAHTHGREGQNVLFLNGRVTFETRAYCAVRESFGRNRERDNIYLISQYADRASPMGNLPYVGVQPANERDSVLVHDPNLVPNRR